MGQALTNCECPCECGATATCIVEGTGSCVECSSYYIDGCGDAICSRIADGITCHHCTSTIKWGVIFTGQPGDSNKQFGECECGTREWLKTEQGPGNWVLSEICDA